jgi:DNA repair protein RecN (Recombination protein N)
MLSSLTITDFAIIDELHLELADGFIVFTGETGAGKSIIIDAVSLILGGKADATLVRDGAEMARVEAVFRLRTETLAEVDAVLRREELLDDADESSEDELTLAREIRREGRSTCRINGRMVSLAVLREVGQYLVDVHGQSEHLSLLRTREHVLLLDRYGLLDAEREAFATQVRELNALRHELRAPPSSSPVRKTRCCRNARGWRTPKSWPPSPMTPSMP